MNTARSLVLIATTSAALSQHANAQVIAVVEPAPGYAYSFARYAAPNGTVVGGSFNSDGLSHRATRWASVGAPPELLGFPPGAVNSFAFRCSDDGQIVAGRYDENSESYPVMWGANGAAVSLSGPGSVSEANGVSADGSIVTGWSATSEGRWMLRWQNGALVQQFGPGFVSGPCSPDGNAAIGIQYLGGSAGALARWTNQGGPNGSTQTLATFPATWSNLRAPTAMTPAADAAIGDAYTVNDHYQSWIWRNGEIIDMGIPDDAQRVHASSIRADGDLVVGNSISDHSTRAEVWTPDTGWEPFDIWLAALGISFPGWTFHQLDHVSPDGLTFAGAGTTPEGQFRGFVVTIPTPGAAAGFMALLGASARRRR